MENTAKGILWNVFNTGTDKAPEYQIQRIDDPRIDLETAGDEIPGQPLDSDMAAVGWVIEEARCGIPEAVEALRVCGVLSDFSKMCPTTKTEIGQPREPSYMTQAELAVIVGTIQGILYLEENPDEIDPKTGMMRDYWNPDKEWDSATDFLDMVANVLASHDLVPDTYAMYEPASELTTGTEIGDSLSSELEQLSDPWHVSRQTQIRDSNGLIVTPAQIIRCKVERDNLLKSLREVMAELTPAQRAYDACQIAEYVLGDIDRHAEGV